MEEERSVEAGGGLAWILAGFAAASVLAGGLCVLSGSETVVSLVLGRNGVCDIATVVFYAVALAILGRDLYRRRHRPWRDNALRLLVAFLCFVLIGEEVRWGLPLVVQDPASYPVLSFQDAVDLAFAPAAPARSLGEIAIVSGVRMGFLLAAFYAGLFLWLRRDRLAGFWGRHAGHPAFLFVAAFVLLTALSLLLDMSGCASGLCNALEEPLEMNAAVAFLLGCVAALPDALKAVPAVSDPRRAAPERRTGAIPPHSVH